MPLCSTPGACWVPNTAPTVSGGGGPAWSGFVVTNPWQTYNTYGDVDILADMYPTMESLLAFYASATQPADGLVHCFGHPCDPAHMNFLGDWITPHGSEGNGTAPENILFNNCCARSNVAFVPAESIHTLTPTCAARRYPLHHAFDR